MGGFQNRPPREICNFCRPELHEKKFLDSLGGGKMKSVKPKRMEEYICFSEFAPPLSGPSLTYIRRSGMIW